MDNRDDSRRAREESPMSRRYLLFVATKPVEGLEDEYDRWYDEEHLHDVVGLEGFQAAQRWVFDRAHPADAEPPEWRNIALYEVEEADYERAAAALIASGAERAEALEAGRIPRVPVSPALHEHRVAYWFAQNSERVERRIEP